MYKDSYVPFFRRRSTIVIGGIVALFGFWVKDLFAERTKEIAVAIQSAKDGYKNEVHFADLSKGIASNFFLLEVIQRRIEENARDAGGHRYNRELGEAINVYGLRPLRAMCWLQVGREPVVPQSKPSILSNC